MPREPSRGRHHRIRTPVRWALTSVSCIALLAITACSDCPYCTLPECSANQKLCWDEFGDRRCVEQSNPRWGCSVDRCAPCALPNAVARCSQGSCDIKECLPGYANCNGYLNDGCEIHTLDDTQNCGRCGAACPGAPSGQTTCAIGVCVLSFESKALDSDGGYSNGCETEGKDRCPP